MRSSARCLRPGQRHRTARCIYHIPAVGGRAAALRTGVVVGSFFAVPLESLWLIHTCTGGRNSGYTASATAIGIPAGASTRASRPISRIDALVLAPGWHPRPCAERCPERHFCISEALLPFWPTCTRSLIPDLPPCPAMSGQIYLKLHICDAWRRQTGPMGLDDRHGAGR